MQPLPPQPEHPAWHAATKVAFGFILTIIAAVAGYLVIYWYVFNDVGNAFGVSVLKSQVVAQQKSADVKDQLKDLGFEFEDDQVFQLNRPNTSHYKASALGGYEPEEIPDEEVKEEGYYFYNADGEAFFFTVDELNQVDPDTMVPLIME